MALQHSSQWRVSCCSHYKCGTPAQFMVEAAHEEGMRCSTARFEHVFWLPHDEVLVPGNFTCCGGHGHCRGPAAGRCRRRPRRHHRARAWRGRRHSYCTAAPCPARPPPRARNPPQPPGNPPASATHICADTPKPLLIDVLQQQWPRCPWNCQRQTPVISPPFCKACPQLAAAPLLAQGSCPENKHLRRRFSPSGMCQSA